MSRLIKKPIALPEGVTVSVRGDLFMVKGPKGEIAVTVVPGIVVVSKDGGIWIEEGKDLMNTAMLGTTWALVRNAVEGVTKGFAKKLEIEGVGYRAAIEGKDIVLYLGYAQPVRVSVPADVAVAVEKNTAIFLSGVSKENVGQLAAKIRALKKPEPYKGKGIHYEGEVIRRKVGKKAGTTTA
jgi:large subunit ribosomal protein L6